MFLLVLFILCNIPSAYVEDNITLRRHYGLSYSRLCERYFQTYKCMAGCKSRGYAVFRMDLKCRCFCHEVKTTTILPFFKWNTVGTTRPPPKTFSPGLYSVKGSTPASTRRPPPTTLGASSICEQQITNGTGSIAGSGSKVAAGKEPVSGNETINDNVADSVAPDPNKTSGEVSGEVGETTESDPDKKASASETAEPGPDPAAEATTDATPAADPAADATPAAEAAADATPAADPAADATPAAETALEPPN